MVMTSAEKVRAYRARQKAAGLPDSSRACKEARRRSERKRLLNKRMSRRFVGCDGEGCGRDELGRQNYMLFRMGDRELFTGSRLTTDELLEFICQEPEGTILTGFSFGYDVTMILRDLPLERQQRLFMPRRHDPGASNFVFYKGWDIEYLPKNYLKVRRAFKYVDENGEERRGTIKGSVRTIWETFGFFQKSFVQVLEEFGIVGEAELAAIQAKKDERKGFEVITPEIRAYCEKECEYLAKLMTVFREYCHEAGIVPYSWSGAGKLSSALHKKHGTPKATTFDNLPPDLIAMADAAYYGGRFEITRTGKINERVHEYDINSAYPSAMRSLPCLIHGEWKKFEGSKLPKPCEVYVAEVSFRTDQYERQDLLGKMMGLPIRDESGTLKWPLFGRGTYWNCEIESAQDLGMNVKLRGGWAYIKHCDCQTFDWIEPLYEYRKSIGSQGPGYPIKLGTNGLYGKLAQRIGVGPYRNIIWAGLTTARTRALINFAISCAGNEIIMIATDGVYSLVEIPELETGDGLGEWDHKVLNGMFVIQPGIYWDPNSRGREQKRKSRGFSRGRLQDEGFQQRFEQAWEGYCAEQNSQLETKPPVVKIFVNSFTGLKLALARNKPTTSGTWVEQPLNISFDWHRKRAYHRMMNGYAITVPPIGYPGLKSVPHSRAVTLEGGIKRDELRELIDEAPELAGFEPLLE